MLGRLDLHDFVLDIPAELEQPVHILDPEGGAGKRLYADVVSVADERLRELGRGTDRGDCDHFAGEGKPAVDGVAGGKEMESRGVAGAEYRFAAVHQRSAGLPDHPAAATHPQQGTLLHRGRPLVRRASDVPRRVADHQQRAATYGAFALGA